MLRVATAVILTAAIQFTLTLVVAHWGGPGIYHAIWVLGAPAFIGTAAFTTTKSRAIAIPMLIVIGLLGMMAAGFFLPAGYH